LLKDPWLTANGKEKVKRFWHDPNSLEAEETKDEGAKEDSSASEHLSLDSMLTMLRKVSITLPAGRRPSI
jgi:hypothetical protein